MGPLRYSYHNGIYNALSSGIYRDWFVLQSSLVSRGRLTTAQPCSKERIKRKVFFEVPVSKEVFSARKIVVFLFFKKDPIHIEKLTSHIYEIKPSTY